MSENIQNPFQESRLNILPENWKRLLYPHQKEGIEFILERIDPAGGLEEPTGVLLADQMGLGKTITCVVAISMYLKEHPMDKVLILAPKSVLFHWHEEMEFLNVRIDFGDDIEKVMMDKNLFSLQSLVICGDSLQERESVLSNWISSNDRKALIMNYEMMHSIVKTDLYQQLLKVVNLVVLDEAHVVKNSSSSISKMLSQFETKRRLSLSAYPVQNNMMEYHALIDYTVPGFLGSAMEFYHKYAHPISQALTVANQTKLARRLTWHLYSRMKEVMLRRTLHIMSDQLPEKTEYVLYFRPPPQFIEIYNKFIKEVRQLHGSHTFWIYSAISLLCNSMDAVHDYVKRKSSLCSSMDEKTHSNALIHLNILKAILDQQGNNLPQSFKMLFVFELIKKCQESKEKLVVFSKSIDVLNQLERFARTQTIPCFRMDGSTNSQIRTSNIQSFNAPNSDVNCYFLSIGTGNEGISLVGSRRVVLLDVNWNPSNDQQALSRVYRIGQTKQVFIYRLIYQDTLEETVFKKQLKKEILSRWAIDNSDETSSYVSNMNRNWLQCIDPFLPQDEAAKEEECQRSLEKDPISAEVIANSERLRKSLQSVSIVDSLLDEIVEISEDEKLLVQRELNWNKVYDPPVIRKKREKTREKRKEDISPNVVLSTMEEKKVEKPKEQKSFRKLMIYREKMTKKLRRREKKHNELTSEVSRYTQEISQAQEEMKKLQVLIFELEEKRKSVENKQNRSKQKLDKVKKKLDKAGPDDNVEEMFEDWPSPEPIPVANSPKLKVVQELNEDIFGELDIVFSSESDSESHEPPYKKRRI